MSDASTIVISYSHKDEDPWKDFVVGHLKVAERQGHFEIWDDRRIKGGGDWRAEIDAAFAKAKVAVILISRHSLTSEFILNHEVETILRRRAEDGLVVYPILISDCHWQAVDWLRQLNLRPTDGTPLNSYDEAERDTVMAAISQEIGEILAPDVSAEGRRVGPATGSTRPHPRGSRFPNQQLMMLAGAAIAAVLIAWAIFNIGDDVTAQRGGVAVGGDVKGDVTVGGQPSEGDE